MKEGHHIKIKQVLLEFLVVAVWDLANIMTFVLSEFSFNFHFPIGRRHLRIVTFLVVTWIWHVMDTDKEIMGSGLNLVGHLLLGELLETGILKFLSV